MYDCLHYFLVASAEFQEGIGVSSTYTNVSCSTRVSNVDPFSDDVNRFSDDEYECQQNSRGTQTIPYLFSVTRNITFFIPFFGIILSQSLCEGTNFYLG